VAGSQHVPNIRQQQGAAHQLARTQCFRMVTLKLLQCIEGGLGVGLLPDADDSVEDQDQEDYEWLDVRADAVF
jgi:hypothetical protein